MRRRHRRSGEDRELTRELLLYGRRNDEVHAPRARRVFVRVALFRGEERHAARTEFLELAVHRASVVPALHEDEMQPGVRMRLAPRQAWVVVLDEDERAGGLSRERVAEPVVVGG